MPKLRRHTVSLHDDALKALKAASRALKAPSLGAAVLHLATAQTATGGGKNPPSAVSVDLTAITGAQNWFSDSRNPELREKRLTLAELVEMAETTSGVAAADLARDGLILRCKTLVQSWHLRQSDPENATVGAADDRLAEAYNRLVEAKSPITFSRLAGAATPIANYNSAKRWLIRNHPELVAGASRA